VAQQSSHGPRVKISSSATTAKSAFLVSVVAVQADKVEGQALTVGHLRLVRKWIVLNYTAIVDFWNGAILSFEFQQRIQSIAGRENDPTLDWDAHLKTLKGGSSPGP
jgi:hypothetical protein